MAVLCQCELYLICGRWPFHDWTAPDCQYAHGGTGSLTKIKLDKNTGRFSSATEGGRTSGFTPPITPSMTHPRQDAAHVHQVICSGDEIIICDLGCNDVWRLKQREGGWIVKGVIGDFQPGDGPRHAVLHPNGRAHCQAPSMS